MGTINVKMAKASEKDIERTIEFFQIVEEFMDQGTYTAPDDTADDATRYLTDEEFVALLREKWGGRFKPAGVDASWQRVVWGYDTLVKNACDPNLDYLEWRSDILAFLESQQPLEVASTGQEPKTCRD